MSNIFGYSVFTYKRSILTLRKSFFPSICIFNHYIKFLLLEKEKRTNWSEFKMRRKFEFLDFLFAILPVMFLLIQKIILLTSQLFALQKWEKGDHIKSCTVYMCTMFTWIGKGFFVCFQWKHKTNLMFS